MSRTQCRRSHLPLRGIKTTSSLASAGQLQYRLHLPFLGAFSSLGDEAGTNPLCLLTEENPLPDNHLVARRAPVCAERAGSPPSPPPLFGQADSDIETTFSTRSRHYFTLSPLCLRFSTCSKAVRELRSYRTDFQKFLL